MRNRPRTFDAAKLPERIRYTVYAVLEQHPEVDLYEIEHDDRRPRITRVRWRIYWTIRQLPWAGKRVTLPLAAKWFGCDHTTIMYGERKYPEIDPYAQAKLANILNRAYEMQRHDFRDANPHKTREALVPA